MHNRWNKIALALASLLLFTACGDDYWADLRKDPHRACLTCHTPGGRVAHFPWTVGGSAFVDETSLIPAQDLWVVLEDAEGRREIMGTNPAGLFHTSKPLTPPFDISIHRDVGNKQYKVVKKIKTPSGDCNTCHRPGGVAKQISLPQP